MTSPSSQFDAAYYKRFYTDTETRAVTAGEQRRLSGFIAAYLEYLELPISSIVDVGCGIGTMLDALAKALPDAHVEGIEISDYLCDRHGWVQGSVTDYDYPADLTLCADVIAYLNARDASQAIENLAVNTRSALYLSVLTEDDLEVCDTQRTDMTQNLRPAAWYKRRLARHFVAVGGGLFLRKPLSIAVWQLERT